VQVGQTTLANGGQSLSVDLPASPSSFYYATVQRSDGAFAVTSPIFVTPNADGPLLINEALAAPDSDLNGDNEENESDEFVELYNPGPLPVSLEGWQLTDVKEMRDGESRFTVSSEHVIPSSGFLVVWRGESHLVLNDDDDHLYLIQPGGGLADEVIWDDAQRDGRSHARTPDGGEWRQDAGSPSPGIGNGSTAASLTAEVAVAPPTVVEAATDAALAESPQVAVTFESATSSTQTGAGGDVDARANILPTLMETGGERRVDETRQTLQGVITLPPGLVDGLFYLAPDGGEPSAAPLAIRLPTGFLPLLQSGDRVEVHVQADADLSELALALRQPQDMRRIAEGTPLQPLVAPPSGVDIRSHGLRMRVLGSILTSTQDELQLADLHSPKAPTLRVVLAYAAVDPIPQPGEVWSATGYALCQESSESGAAVCQLHVIAGDDLQRLLP
jgi:hypothetical protein